MSSPKADYSCGDCGSPSARSGSLAAFNTQLRVSSRAALSGGKQGPSWSTSTGFPSFEFAICVTCALDITCNANAIPRACCIAVGLDLFQRKSRASPYEPCLATQAH